MYYISLGEDLILLEKIRKMNFPIPKLPFDNLIDIGLDSCYRILKHSINSQYIPKNFLKSIEVIDKEKNLYQDKIYGFKIVISNKIVIKDLLYWYENRFINLYKILNSDERINFTRLQKKDDNNVEYIQQIYNLFSDKSLISFKYISLSKKIKFKKPWFQQYIIKKKDFMKKNIWDKIFDLSNYRTVLTTNNKFEPTDIKSHYDDDLIKKFKKITRWIKRNTYDIEKIKIWKGYNNQYLINFNGREQIISDLSKNDIIYLNSKLINSKDQKYILTKIGNYKFSIHPKSFTQTNIYESYFIYSYITNFVEGLINKNNIKKLIIYGRNSHHISAFFKNLNISKEYYCQHQTVIKDTETSYKLNKNKYPEKYLIFKENKDDFFNNNKDSLLILTPGSHGFRHFKKLKYDRVIYFSCNFKNLKRDLSTHNYYIQEHKNFNILPNTSTDVDLLYLTSKITNNFKMIEPCIIKKSFEQPLLELEYLKQIELKEEYFQTKIIHNNRGIFKGIKSNLVGTRYHSLVIDQKTLSEDFIITAKTKDNVIMGIMHKNFNLHGVQFHPESIKTSEGMKLIKNFIKFK